MFHGEVAPCSMLADKVCGRRHGEAEEVPSLAAAWPSAAGAAAADIAWPVDFASTPVDAPRRSCDFDWQSPGVRTSVLVPPSRRTTPDSVA
jgi:hypothetical protein